MREENEALRVQRSQWQSENEALRLQHSQWQSENEALRIQLQELEVIRRNLEHTVAVYKRCLFGSRSEKIDPKELEARIAQAAAEAREQLAQEKRPGDPPPEAEEEQTEKPADTPAAPVEPPADKPGDREKENKRKARPTAAEVFQRIYRVDESNTPLTSPRLSVRVARIIRPWSK